MRDMIDSQMVSLDGFIRFQLGLIDEYSRYVNPVVLGGGKSMFPALDRCGSSS